MSIRDKVVSTLVAHPNARHSLSDLAQVTGAKHKMLLPVLGDLIVNDYVRRVGDGGYELTDKGRAFLGGKGGGYQTYDSWS